MGTNRRWGDLSNEERAAFPTGTTARTNGGVVYTLDSRRVWVRFSPSSPNLTDCREPSEDAVVGGVKLGQETLEKQLKEAHAALRAGFEDSGYCLLCHTHHTAIHRDEGVEPPTCPVSKEEDWK